MPYLRLTSPSLEVERRIDVAERLTDAIVDLFTPPRGPTAEEIRQRTTVRFTPYEDHELFVGGRPSSTREPDVTAELSDWSMSTRQQARVGAGLTPTLAGAFNADPDAVNVRFHSYPPTDFAVGADC
jgi:phenylpyruvate tautomerase PptA (4-oxalocrotonate tautomerase family)